MALRQVMGASKRFPEALVTRLTGLESVRRIPLDPAVVGNHRAEVFMFLFNGDAALPTMDLNS